MMKFILYTRCIHIVLTLHTHYNTEPSIDLWVFRIKYMQLTLYLFLRGTYFWYVSKMFSKYV